MTLSAIVLAAGEGTRMRSQRPKPRPKEFIDGEEFLYLGRKYELSLVPRATKDVELTDRLCLADRVRPFASRALKRWYQVAARQFIGQRCEWYAASIGCQPVSVKINDARKRWGSCGSKGTLNFSWRLIMAPPDIIDYVVVHELAHIGQLNHSAAFWRRVADVLPDYKIREAWLQENGGLLTL